MPLKPESVQVYHVFLASPGDMKSERRAVREFFENYNRHTARLWRVRFEVIDCENYSMIGIGRPQELITQQTLEKYSNSLAVVIGLMGQRFGAATGEAESGTEEEFNWALENYRKTGSPEIKWFFRTVESFNAPPGTVEIKKALDQWESVKRFRKSMQESKPQIYYKEYQDMESFRYIFNNDLSLWLADSERPWSDRRETRLGIPANGVAPPHDISPDKIQMLAKNIMQYEISHAEIELLRKDLVINEMTDLNQFEKTISDQATNALIGSIYQKRLRRKPKPFEVLQHAILLSRYEEAQKSMVLDNLILSSQEFIAKTRFIFNFNGHPLSTINFDRAGQEAFGFQTYHYKRSDGTLQIAKSNTIGYDRELQLISNTGEDFNVMFPISLPRKKVLAIDFTYEGKLHFFTYVSSDKGKQFFIQYIEGEGIDEVKEHKGSVYVLVHGNGVANGPDMLRREMELNNDLSRLCNENVIHLHNFIICTRKQVNVFNILID